MNTTYKDATQSTAGLLSTADKKKLDAFGEASTYATKEDVTKQIADAGHIKKQIVESLPAASAAADNVIYMVAKKTANGDNAYDEYMLVSSKTEGAHGLSGRKRTVVPVAQNQIGDRRAGYAAQSAGQQRFHPSDCASWHWRAARRGCICRGPLGQDRRRDGIR